MKNPESVFQKQVKKRLESLPNCYHFTKEALTIRGLPDIIGCINGKFFAWELKKCMAETQRLTGRTVLQRYILGLIRKAGGIGEFVCPENLEDNLQKILSV